MKTNKLFVAGMFALALTFMVVACSGKAQAQTSGGGSSDSGSSGGGSSEKKAEKALQDALASLDDAAIAEAAKGVSPDVFTSALKAAPPEAFAKALRYASPEMVANLILAGANPGGDFAYDLNKAGNGIIIKSYTGTNPNLVIPKEIEGYPVVQIGETKGLYSINGGISSVVIPEGVKIIASSAFNNVRSNGRLKSAVFPASLTEIQEDAFKSTGLVNVDLSATSLTVIGESAFGSCDNLRTVKLPDTVTSIGDDAFRESKALTDINIPASIKTIGGVAFFNCRELYNLAIPESITAIRFTGENHFYGCGKLQLRTRQRLKDLGYKGDF